MKRLILIALLFPALAAAQVYKCEGPDGPIYSQRECEPGAAKVTLPDPSAGLGGQVSRQTQIDLAQKKLYREQDRYRGRLYDRRDRDLATIDSQIGALNSKKSLANNNLAGATYAAGIDTQIAALRASRSNVVTSYREQITKTETDGF